MDDNMKVQKFSTVYSTPPPRCLSRAKLHNDRKFPQKASGTLARSVYKRRLASVKNLEKVLFLNESLEYCRRPRPPMKLIVLMSTTKACWLVLPGRAWNTASALACTVPSLHAHTMGAKSKLSKGLRVESPLFKRVRTPEPIPFYASC